MKRAGSKAAAVFLAVAVVVLLESGLLPTGRRARAEEQPSLEEQAKEQLQQQCSRAVQLFNEGEFQEARAAFQALDPMATDLGVNLSELTRAAIADFLSRIDAELAKRAEQPAPGVTLESLLEFLAMCLLGLIVFWLAWCICRLLARLVAWISRVPRRRAGQGTLLASCGVVALVLLSSGFSASKLVVVAVCYLNGVLALRGKPRETQGARERDMTPDEGRAGQGQGERGAADGLHANTAETAGVNHPTERAARGRPARSRLEVGFRRLAIVLACAVPSLYIAWGLSSYGMPDPGEWFIIAVAGAVLFGLVWGATLLVGWVIRWVIRGFVEGERGKKP